MQNFKLNYKVKTAKESEILAHLTACNFNFMPPLETKTNLEEYSSKLFLKSITFEAWSGSLLVGLVAAYFTGDSGFISNVSTMSDFKGNGLGSQLMKMCLNYAQEFGVRTIRLEVNCANINAIKLYQKYGFLPEEVIGDQQKMKLELAS